MTSTAYNKALLAYIREQGIDMSKLADQMKTSYKVLYNQIAYLESCSADRWLEIAERVGFNWHPWERDIMARKKSNDEKKKKAQEKVKESIHKNLELERLKKGKKQALEALCDALEEDLAEECKEERMEERTQTAGNGSESRDNAKQVKDIAQEEKTADKGGNAQIKEPVIISCNTEIDVKPYLDCSSFYQEASADDVPEQVDPTKEFVEFVGGMFDELKKQFIAKNNQYGDKDPLGNFRKGAFLRYGNDSYENMFQAALDYEGKHLAHVYGHGTDGKAVDESLKDIAIYSIIELFMLKKAQEE